MSFTLKSKDIRAIERQVEELRILNAKLHAQVKKITQSKISESQKSELKINPSAHVVNHRLSFPRSPDFGT